MKLPKNNILVTVTLCVLIGTVAYMSGNSNGYRNGIASEKIDRRASPIEKIQDELKSREMEIIEGYLKGSAKIKRNDEGGLFNVDIKHYLKGTLSNSALLATAKDIKIKVEFISKTGTKISDYEFIIYDYVKPGESVNFSEEIEISEDVTEFNYKILDAKPE